MDSETELEAKLGDWRGNEELGCVKLPATTKLRKRKKRREPSSSKAGHDSSTTTPRLDMELPAPQEIIPDTSVPPEVESAALSRTLLRSRVDQKWSTLRGVNIRANTRIVKKQRASSKKAKAQETGNAAQLVERFRHEVGTLGAAGLQKRQRKAYDEALLGRLGFCKARNQKMPLTILEGLRRAEKKRQLKDIEKKREEGVLLSGKRKNRQR